jgi:hypothetical protein
MDVHLVCVGAYLRDIHQAEHRSGCPGRRHCARGRPRQRAALVLRYYADFSAVQIAEVMGISEGAVRRHLQRATASLRAVLDGS